MTKTQNNHPEDYLPLILTAPVYDVCDETPLTRATNLSNKFKCNFLLKREDLQPVFSFKLRGAYTCMKNLTPEEKANGVVACSAGNHAQGVALAAQKLGINAKIVMPLATPAIKWENVKRLGATVVLYGNDFDEAKQRCMQLVVEENRTNIPPYDHPQVIAGQGTVAVEILRQCSMGQIDTIFCCIGGGGLVSGVAAYVKRLYPNIKIIGVETVDSNAMFESLKTGEPVELQQVGLFADGAAVRLVGQETFRLCYELLDGHILVTNDEICAAIKDIFEDTRSIVEPAGALSVAGLKKWIKINQDRRLSLDSLKLSPTNDPNQRFHYVKEYELLLSNKFVPSESTDQLPTHIAVTSGANMNFNRLRYVADRAEIGLEKEALVSVVIPERPGAFITLHSLILPRAVTSFAYRYTDPDNAYIFISFSLLDPSQKQKEIDELFKQLEQNGMKATDLTNNDLAKDHGRFLIGGRSSVLNEKLYRFEFPERPDALFNFLKGLKFSWNVSLFQYRNTGGDTGKVLVGIQVPEDDLTEFNDFLIQLNYPWIDETNNYVYTKFLTQ